MLMQLAMLNKSSSNSERREILPRHHGPGANNGLRSTPVAVRRLFYFVLTIAVFIALVASYYSTIAKQPQDYDFSPVPRTGTGTDVNYTNPNPLKNSGFYTVLRPSHNGTGTGPVVLSELSPYQTRTVCLHM